MRGGILAGMEPDTTAPLPTDAAPIQQENTNDVGQDAAVDAVKIPDKSPVELPDVELRVEQLRTEEDRLGQTTTDENRLGQTSENAASGSVPVGTSLPESVLASPPLPDSAPINPSLTESVLVGTSLPESVPVGTSLPESAIVGPRVYGKEDRLRAKEKKRAQVELMLGGIMTYAVDKRDALVNAGLVSAGSGDTENDNTQDAVVGISNDEVEAKLGVSDTTAAKYLKELVARGLLEKRGKGRGVVYRVV